MGLKMDLSKVTIQDYLNFLNEQFGVIPNNPVKRPQASKTKSLKRLKPKNPKIPQAPLAPDIVKKKQKALKDLTPIQRREMILRLRKRV